MKERVLQKKKESGPAPAVAGERRGAAPSPIITLCLPEANRPGKKRGKEEKKESDPPGRRQRKKGEKKRVDLPLPALNTPFSSPRQWGGKRKQRPQLARSFSFRVLNRVHVSDTLGKGRWGGNANVFSFTCRARAPLDARPH